MSKVTLKVRFGPISNKFDATNPSGIRAVTDDIRTQLVNSASKDLNVNIGKLAINLSKVIENSYVSAMNYAAKNMIGRSSPRSGVQGSGNKMTSVPGPDGLTIARWQVLSPQTVAEQNAMRGTEKDKGKFFLQTGSLRAEILAMARMYVKNTGVVRVSYIKALRGEKGRFVSPLHSSATVKVSDLTLRLMPNINPASLPGLLSGRPQDHNPNIEFEKKLGFSMDALTKLQGAVADQDDYAINLVHRPLIQPVFTYWTLNRIPKLIANSINREVQKAVEKVDLNRIATRDEAARAGAVASRGVMGSGGRLVDTGGGSRKGGSQ